MIAVIMAGGSGTRFWPRSTKKEPKQFLPLAGERSLLAETAKRIEPLIPPERVLVVTGADFVEQTRREIPGIPPENVIGEPLGRNTAPCVALAAAVVGARWGDDTVMLVLPADHHIAGPERFLQFLEVGGAYCCGEKALLTFGIEPVRPETGYGYLEIGRAAAEIDGISVRQVIRFVEKPDRPTAEGYLAAGNYLWNSGMFLWRADAIREALETHMPESRGPMERFAGADPSRLSQTLAEEYPHMPAQSIDYAVMEKAENVVAIATDFPWSDVGSWDALDDLLEPDGESNRVVGHHLGVDSRGCIVFAPKRLVATIGVENLIVVETDDAVLVCPRDRAQDVKRVVERLREEGGESFL